jgi:hypothetical protein
MRDCESSIPLKYQRKDLRSKKGKFGFTKNRPQAKAIIAEEKFLRLSGTMNWKILPVFFLIRSRQKQTCMIL